MTNNPPLLRCFIAILPLSIDLSMKTIMFKAFAVISVYQQWVVRMGSGVLIVAFVLVLTNRQTSRNGT